MKHYGISIACAEKCLIQFGSSKIPKLKKHMKMAFDM